MGETQSTVEEAVIAAHKAGLGGYKKLAALFGLSRSTVRSYLGKASPSTRAKGERYFRCERKQRFASEEDAYAKMRTLPIQEGPRTDTVYACGFCGGFHFGRGVELSAHGAARV